MDPRIHPESSSDSVEWLDLCDTIEAKEFLRLGYVIPVPNHTKVISP